MTIVLNSKSFRWNIPVSTDGEFLWIIRRPNLNPIDVIVAQASLLHEGDKAGTVVVVSSIAH